MRNPPLYNALVRAFGDVRIANEDEAAIFAPPARTAVLNRLRGAGTPRRDLLPVRVYGGEQYHICCPYCRDRRYRLYVSHAWDRHLEDERGRRIYAGKRAVCQNEDCLADRNNFEAFDRKIRENLQEADRSPLKCSSNAAALEARVAELPTSLPLADPAAFTGPRDYLAGRGFDVQELSRDWHVRSGRIWFYPEPAVIFPVYQHGTLKAWQARYAGEDSKLLGKPKYFWPSGVKKSWMLYNLDGARYYPAAVLVEGVLDAIRIGPVGVAMFGKCPSDYQERLLCAHWQNGALLWMPDENDPESIKAANERTAVWNSRKLFAGGAHVVRLPDKDPGAHEREYLWSLIVQRAPSLSRFAERCIRSGSGTAASTPR